MKTIYGRDTWKNAVRFSLFAAFLCCPSWAATASPHAATYQLVDLGIAGPAGQPFQISNNGLISAALEKNGTDHSVIYFDGHVFEISHHGLGGANSMAYGVTEQIQVAGVANNNEIDRNGEDFCGFQALGLRSAANRCLPYLWQNGQITALPTLDDNRGSNGVAKAINNAGTVAGAAETTLLDPGCPPYDPSKGQFQQFQVKPAIWVRGAVTELPTVEGDPDGVVESVNDRGEAVGATGTCSTYNPILPVYMQPLHAVFWEKSGTSTDLKSLGGDQHSQTGTAATAINNRGQVVGLSSLADDVTFHAFLWTKQSGKMRDLGTASGIQNSAAIALNDQGVVVGVSLDANHFSATIWKNGVAADLNNLISSSPLHLMVSCSINAQGQIIGWALDQNGAVHGYLLNPVEGSEP